MELSGTGEFAIISLTMMNATRGAEPTELQVGDVRWSDYSVLRALSMEYNGEHRGYDLALCLATQDEPGPEAIRVECVGAVHIVLDGAESGVIVSSGFVVEDISDRQWEGLRWEFHDYENGLLRFYCQRIRIVSVSASGDER